MLPKYRNSGGTAHLQAGQVQIKVIQVPLSQPLPCQEMTVYTNEELLPLRLKPQNSTGEKTVITDQKQASCPSQPQGMGTCPPLAPGSEG